jgi:hypothetical protein
LADGVRFSASIEAVLKKGNQKAAWKMEKTSSTDRINLRNSARDRGDKTRIVSFSQRDSEDCIMPRSD